VEEIDHLFRLAADHAAAYRRSLPDRPVGVPIDQRALADGFSGPLPAAPCPPEQVLADLVAAVEPGLVASAGPRYFGFVVGGASAAATAADMLAAGWDQIATNTVTSPAAIAAEAAAGAWLKDLLGIPPSASAGFVTGCQAATTVGLAAARHQLLADAGWNVERRGLRGAPPVRVIAGDERHVTIDRSLRLLGIGTDAVEAVPAGPNGAIDPDRLRELLRAGPSGPTIVCLQAGNVNTGACDQLRDACELAHRNGWWVHVDGAFGLWAAAASTTRQLVDGLELADSWACDGHKWLNLPYDSGFAFCAHPHMHAAAMSFQADYLVGSGGDPAGADLTTESSRRARGFAAWAGLRELGRDGVAAMVDRCCALARRFAVGLTAAGFEVANEVVLNQVLVRFGDDARTDRVLAAVPADGTCWAGGTTWRGRRFMRISVSNATTTEADVDRSVAAITRLAI
jgi:glutamate/tyrosine decarboxylase-like PLP-dependent enzyme